MQEGLPVDAREPPCRLNLFPGDDEMTRKLYPTLLILVSAAALHFARAPGLADGHARQRRQPESHKERFAACAPVPPPAVRCSFRQAVKPRPRTGEAKSERKPPGPSSQAGPPDRLRGNPIQA